MFPDGLIDWAKESDDGALTKPVIEEVQSRSQESHEDGAEDDDSKQFGVVGHVTRPGIHESFPI
jgi:hypothetical protein